MDYDHLKAALPPDMQAQMDASAWDWAKIWALFQAILPVLLPLFLKNPPRTSS